MVALERYLRSSFHPDREYLDGVLVERNVGEYRHAIVVGNLIHAFAAKWPVVRALPAVRARISPTRYRVPDLAVVLERPKTACLISPPFIAVEVLSDRDPFCLFWEKLKEYAAAGTPNIWVFDPRLRRMFIFRDNALMEVLEDVIATGDPRLELTREEVFAE